MIFEEWSESSMFNVKKNKMSNASDIETLKKFFYGLI